jgi:hypothetical protein
VDTKHSFRVRCVAWLHSSSQLVSMDPSGLVLVRRRAVDRVFSRTVIPFRDLACTIVVLHCDALSYSLVCSRTAVHCRALSCAVTYCHVRSCRVLLRTPFCLSFTGVYCRG